MNWFMAFLHHLAAFALVSALVYEWLLLRKPLTVERAQSLIKIDQLYGASALAILVVGSLRLFYFEKGANYYFYSGPFIVKLALFVAVGLLSIYPTKTFLSWRKDVYNNRLPAVTAQQQQLLHKIISIQLLGIAGILCGAAMSAKGIGFLNW